MISIENNEINLKIANALMKNIRAFSTSMERMTTGLKINSGKDDPAGFYISSRFATQISGLDTANTNIQNAINILEQADKSLEEVSELLNKMRDLIESSCSEYLTPKEREEKQKQINSLFAQAMKVKNETEVDGFKVFNDKQTLDKTQTYTDGKVTIAAGQVLNQITPAQQQAQAAAAAANAANEPAAAVGDMGVDDGAMPAYSPEDDDAAAIPAAYSPEEDYSVVAEEYAEDDDEMALAFDDGGVADANAGIAPVDDMGVAPAAYGGEDTSGETPTEYVTGDYVPLDGMSEEEIAALEAAAASNNGNDGIAIASTIVDSGSVTITSSPQTITIGSNSYDVYGTSGDVLNWSLDDAGQIAFQTDSTNHIGIWDNYGQHDNVAIDGQDIQFHGNDGNDIITITGKSGGLYSGSGKDIIIVEENATVYGTIGLGADNDTIIVNGVVKRDDTGNKEIYDEDGTDTLIWGANASIGGYGIGDKQTAIENGNVYGVETVSDTAQTSGSVTVAAGETQTIIIGDKMYDVYGGSGSTGLSWAIDGNNQITFESSGDLKIVAHDGQDDNVAFEGTSRIYFDSGDGSDTVEVKEGATIAGASLGFDNDTFINNGSVIHNVLGGDGDDVIYNYGAIATDGTSLVYGGSHGYDSSTNDTLIYSADSSVGGSLSSTTNSKITGIENFVTDSPQTSGTITADGTYTIDGKNYTVDLYSGSLDWSVEDGVITFTTDSGATITAADGQQDNVIINSSDGWINFYAGDMDDTIASNSGYVYGEEGNDYITLTTGAHWISGGDGNDTIINEGVIGEYQYIYANAGDDSIINNGTMWQVNGGDGDDTVVNNGTLTGSNLNTEHTGTTQPTITVTSTTQTIIIGDKKYDVYSYYGGTATLNWSVDDAGQITFQADSGSRIHITAADGQADNVIVDGAGIIFQAGDMDDTIVINEDNSAWVVYGEEGDDSIINRGAIKAIHGGDGDDSIVNDGDISIIYGGNDYTDTSTNDKLIYGANSSVGDYGINDVQSAIDAGKIDGIEFVVDENGNPLPPGSVNVTSTTQTITIGDKKYDVYGWGDDSNKTLNWSVDDAGQITFQTDSTNEIYITAHSGQADNVSLNGADIRFYAGDMDDYAIVKEGNQALIISMGDGNDTIENKGTARSIDGASDNDLIINYEMSYTSYMADGNNCDSTGDDTIINRGTVGENGIAIGGGSDVIENYGTVEGTIRDEFNDENTDSLYFGSSSSVGGYGIDGVFDAVEANKISGVEKLYNEDGKQIVRKSGSVDLTGTSGNSPTTISITKSNGEVYQYDVYTTNSNAILNWSIDENDQITFQPDSSTNGISIDVRITAHSGQEDNVSLNGEGIWFSAGDMNDNVIVKEGNNAGIISMGSGDDTLISYSTAITTIGLDAGDDIFYNYGNMLMQAGGSESGNDTVYNYGTADEIDIGAGDDVVYNYGSVGNEGRASGIEGGAGNDTIINESGAFASYINSGDGNDYVSNSGEIFKHVYLDTGDDTFENNGSIGGWLDDSGGNNSITNNGVIVAGASLGAGNDTIYNYGTLGLINTSEGDDYIYNYSQVDGNILSGDGNDQIYIHSDNNSVYGEDGDDMVFVYSDGNTIYTADGNDEVTIVGSNNYVDGGTTGVDIIATNGKNNSYTGMDELVSSTRDVKIQTDYQFSDYSSFELNISAFLPDMEFSVSSADNAKESLQQLDEIIKSITASRTTIGAQNVILEEKLEHNITRMSNLENSRSLIQDADTAEEYSKLISSASTIEQLQLLQSQANSNHYNIVSRLIFGVVG